MILGYLEVLKHERTEVEFVDVTNKYNEIRTNLLRGQGKEDSNYNNIIKRIER